MASRTSPSGRRSRTTCPLWAVSGAGADGGGRASSGAVQVVDPDCQRAGVLAGEMRRSGAHARCRATPGLAGSQVRRWLPLSMAATLLLAVGGVFIAGQQAAFAAQLAIDHEKCFIEFGTGHPPLDTAAAEDYLATVHGVDVVVPVGDGQEPVELVDARSCEYDGGRTAHLLYEVEGREVSLFVVPDGSHAERSIEVVWHQARLWSAADAGYVLVGDVGGGHRRHGQCCRVYASLCEMTRWRPKTRGMITP